MLDLPVYCNIFSASIQLIDYFHKWVYCCTLELELFLINPHNPFFALFALSTSDLSFSSSFILAIPL